MKQRTIMILTTILTAFMLVVVGGIVRNVTAGNANVSNSAPSNQEPAYQEPAAPAPAASDQMMVGVTADSATANDLGCLAALSRIRFRKLPTFPPGRRARPGQPGCAQACT